MQHIINLFRKPKYITLTPRLQDTYNAIIDALIAADLYLGAANALAVALEAERDGLTREQAIAIAMNKAQESAA